MTTFRTSTEDARILEEQDKHNAWLNREIGRGIRDLMDTVKELKGYYTMPGEAAESYCRQLLNEIDGNTAAIREWMETRG